MLGISSLYAQEITILYTGETHAMVYPCNCPVEPDGGIARRATLIKQLRKENPHTLLLDSGGFFGGGVMDEYGQNTQLDMQRTSVNLKAMELMGYDAVAVGDDEFNFGRQFFQERINNTNLNFLSCNMPSDTLTPKISPYIIKEISGIKIGIIGVTGLFAAQKAEAIKFIEPKLSVKKAIQELRGKGANIIVLLSHLGEDDDLRMIKEAEGIDILIIGHSRKKERHSDKVGSTLILRPSWQGRKLGKLSFTFKDNEITGHKTEELRLSKEISDDPDMLSILPQCFSDANCKKEGFIGACKEAGSLNSRCEFVEATRVPLLVISPKACRTCNTEQAVSYLKRMFPGLSVSYLYYPDAQANELIKDFNIKGLPVYLLGKEAEKEKAFDNLKENLELKKDFFMLKPQFIGVSYFLGRKKVKGQLDLFISLYNKDTPELLDAIKEFNPAIHFLASQQKDGFEAANGNLEVEEYLRSVCVQKYYPQDFWGYISCRSKNINSSWWDDCAGQDMDTNKIRLCARSQEARDLLKENTVLNRELQVMLGPTYLLDNQEVFGSQGPPSKEELRNIFKK